jgi:hypothetical protein
MVETAAISGAVTARDQLRKLEAGTLQMPARGTIHDGTCRRVAAEGNISLRVWGWRNHRSSITKLGHLAEIYAPRIGVSKARLHAGFDDVADAARRELGRHEEEGMSSQAELIERVRALPPESGAITHIEGEPSARAYLTIHAAGTALRESVTHKNKTQIYVDTLGATVDTVHQDWGLSRPDLVIATAALLHDTVATQAALASLHPEHSLVNYETNMTGNGVYTARLAA